MLLFPNAKINLGLRVVRKRSDGYHDIETLFYPVPDLCDVLEIVHAASFGIRVYHARIEGENICERAWRLLNGRFGIPPVEIHLYKKIPAGAGLGGGSADAAFTLKGLNALFGLNLSDDDLSGLAGQLGSDCPFFIYNRPMLARGRGEILTPMAFSLAGHDLRIFPQSVFVSTKEAYAGITPHMHEVPLESILKRPVEEWKDLLVNDFETTVFARYPELARAKQALYDEGARYVSMSGSGSALFAVY